MTTEELLRASLHACADRTTFEPTSLLEVAARARRLRRQRARNVVLATAAAVAVTAVPVGIVLTSDDPRPSPAPAAPSGPPTVTIGSLSELPTGAPPAVDHVLGETYVFASGEQVEMDVEPGSVRDAAPYHGGILVTANTPATASIGIATQHELDRTGSVRATGCGTEELALSPDGALTLFGYLDYPRDCEHWIGPILAWGPAARAGADKDIVTSNGQRLEPVGVTDGRALYNTFDADSGDPLWVTITTELGPPVEVPGLTTASAWDPATSRVAGCRGDGSCVVVDEQDGAVLLTLDTGEEPLSFSPDGRYLATVTGWGETSATVSVRDSQTGDRVVTLAGEEDAYQGDPSAVAWEDDRHLLLSRGDADGEALVRLGVDGSLALATPVAEPTLGGYLLPGA